jgi:hypothetical protein
MQIFVSYNGSLVTLDVEPSDIIEAIRSKTQLITGIPINQQILTFNGTILQDGLTLSDYNIQKESTIILTLNMLIAIKPGVIIKPGVTFKVPVST